jgi:tetratricopeptide (TPR) repeat protein
LFYEYYKNHDYQSAYPFGWYVLNHNPEPFKKYNIYAKMEDVLWQMHDSLATSDEQKKEITDTALYFYDQAVKDATGKEGYFQVRKAYVMSNWVKAPAEDVIAAYEKAFEMDPGLDSYYADQLGLLYINNATEENGYKVTALELYSKLAQKEPENQLWNERMKGLADNPGQLVDILEKAWKLDHENVQRAWQYASAAMSDKQFERAIEPLTFLTEKSPDVTNYWNQLASAYQKIDQPDKAVESYKKLLALQPENRDAYLNLGIIYKDKNQLGVARNYLQKAVEVSPGWGYPVYVEGTLYEQAARGCTFDFNAKVVYLLAQETYKKAKNMDPNVAGQAQDRIAALSNSVPTQEDFFFRRLKSGDTIKIEGQCYDWINRTVTVP